MKIKSILPGAGLAALSIVLSVCAAELVLRWLYPATIRYYVWQPRLRHTFHPDTSLLHGLKSPSRFGINSCGVRSNKGGLLGDNNLFENDKNRVLPPYYLCMGGSTTECLYLDNDSTWPAQLENIAYHKNLLTGNIGKSGCTSLENFIQLKYCVSQYKGVKAVIVMIGLNDILKWLSRSREPGNNFQLTPQAEDSLADIYLLKEGRNMGKTWWRRSAIFYMLQNAYHKNKSSGVKWENVADDSGEVYKTWREHREHASQIIDSLPALDAALAEYEHNLNLIIDEAGKQHLKIVFVNQSALWKDSMPENEMNLLWMGGIGNYQQKAHCAYYSPAALRKALNLYNDKLRSVCHDNGIQMIDLDAQLPHAPTIFYDDCHFTDAGARKAAEIISRAMGFSR